MIVARTRISMAVAVLTALATLLGAAAARAQGNCTMKQLAGTYAFESHGSITFSLEPYPNVEWSMVTRPLIMLSLITIAPDGAMNGPAWVILGRVVTAGLVSSPLVGQLVELDEPTCTAVLEWRGNPTPGKPPALHRERVVFVDNGREFRSMLKYSPSGAMAWVGRGHRITHHRITPDVTVGNCGPHLLAGDVLLQCESVGIEGRAVTATSLARLVVDHDGTFTGTMDSKDPVFAELTVAGAFDVQPDCSVGLTLEALELPGVVHRGMGVIFDDGKGGYFIHPLETSLPDGSLVKPAYARCELFWLGR